jgi:(p)ppGpp synthase/HD superfamily hydrolase
MVEVRMPQAAIDEALELAVRYFSGVKDKDGEPYIMHCLRVMHGVTDPLAQQVAVMHDLVEDTEVTLEMLRERGFDVAVVEAVELVTHPPELSYAEYVMRLKSNPLARQVKLSDLRDNAALNRIAYRAHQTDRDLRRIQRYVLSYQYLTDRIDASLYRQQMQNLED